MVCDIRASSRVKVERFYLARINISTVIRFAGILGFNGLFFT